MVEVTTRVMTQAPISYRSIPILCKLLPGVSFPVAPDISRSRAGCSKKEFDSDHFGLISVMPSLPLLSYKVMPLAIVVHSRLSLPIPEPKAFQVAYTNHWHFGLGTEIV